MTRLFDAGKEADKADEVRRAREEAKRRAEEFDKMMADSGMADKEAENLHKLIKSGPLVTQAVAPIRYEAYRRPGSRWLIEHARAGDDYIYQCFPLRPPTAHMQDVLGLMIAAMDVIFPRTVQISYTPPNEQYQVKYYTVRVQNVATVPGWEAACRERALVALASLDAWQQA